MQSSKIHLQPFPGHEETGGAGDGMAGANLLQSSEQHPNLPLPLQADGRIGK